MLFGRKKIKSINLKTLVIHAKILRSYFSRYEHLMARRQLLLNSVLLRQNPHNVNEWLNRVKLYEEEPEKVNKFYS